MKITINKLALCGALASILAISLGASVSAHVVVKPSEVVTAGFQTFTIGVPNEKEIPTTSIKLAIPAGLKHVSPTTKPGWKISINADENDSVTSITWSGGMVEKGLRDDFTFSAQVPEKSTKLQWKAYQTYADGTVVSWDKPIDSNDHDGQTENTGPSSVTKVVDKPSAQQTLETLEQTTLANRTMANRALYLGVAAVIISLIGIFLVTKRK